jgi:hypothetical protein
MVVDCTTLLKLNINRVPARAWRKRPAAGARRSKDPEDVVRAPGPELASIELNRMPIRRDAEPSRADHATTLVTPDSSRTVQFIEKDRDCIGFDAGHAS